MKNVYKLLSSVLLMGWVHFSTGQVTLGESINSGILPSDDDPICELPIWPELAYYENHFALEEVVPDFTLFDLDGNEYNLQTIMADGKPVLLINGSLTCPVFRERIVNINEVQALYGDVLNTFVIYTAEAHPTGDVSPYFGIESEIVANTEEGILYPQPVTYAERKGLVALLEDYATIDVPVLIDGPCNEFWLEYGTYANDAYFIDSNGAVADWHKWFTKYPDNIFATLENYFGEAVPEEPDPVGDFAIGYYNGECHYGDPGSTIVAHVSLVNTDTVDAWVSIQREEFIPADWQTSLCLDICYPPDVDTADILIPAGDGVEFSVYFYTGDDVGTGQVQLHLEQALNQDLFYYISLDACTDEETIILSGQGTNGLTVYPNPADEWIHVDPTDSGETATIYLMNATGRVVRTMDMNKDDVASLDVSELPAGVYLLMYEQEGIRSAEKVIVE